MKIWTPGAWKRVMKLLNEKPEMVAEILEHFSQDPDVERHADAFLNNAVKTMMEVMDYEELAQVVQENAAYEDLNRDKR